MWPWAAISFPSNLYSSATASNPGQQLLYTTSKWGVGPWHLISACRSGEPSGELRRWKQRHRQVKGQCGVREYWMTNVISFISARVCTQRQNWFPGVESELAVERQPFLWPPHPGCKLYWMKWFTYRIINNYYAISWCFYIDLWLQSVYLFRGT